VRVGARERTWRSARSRQNRARVVQFWSLRHLLVLSSLIDRLRAREPRKVGRVDSNQRNQRFFLTRRPIDMCRRYSGQADINSRRVPRCACGNVCGFCGISTNPRFSSHRRPVASCRKSFRSWPLGSLRARLSRSATCLRIGDANFDWRVMMVSQARNRPRASVFQMSVRQSIPRPKKIGVMPSLNLHVERVFVDLRSIIQVHGGELWTSARTCRAVPPINSQCPPTWAAHRDLCCASLP
jgi:hypothetical protein